MQFFDVLTRALLALGVLLAIASIAFRMPPVGLVGVALLATALALMLAHAGPHRRPRP